MPYLLLIPGSSAVRISFPNPVQTIIYSPVYYEGPVRLKPVNYTDCLNKSYNFGEALASGRYFFRYHSLFYCQMHSLCRFPFITGMTVLYPVIPSVIFPVIPSVISSEHILPEDSSISNYNTCDTLLQTVFILCIILYGNTITIPASLSGRIALPFSISFHNDGFPHRFPLIIPVLR